MVKYVSDLPQESKDLLVRKMINYNIKYDTDDWENKYEFEMGEIIGALQSKVSDLTPETLDTLNLYYNKATGSIEEKQSMDDIIKQSFEGTNITRETVHTMLKVMEIHARDNDYPLKLEVPQGLIEQFNTLELLYDLYIALLYNYGEEVSDEVQYSIAECFIDFMHFLDDDFEWEK